MELVVGGVPSVVKKIVVDGVVEVMLTVCFDVYVPSPGLKTGVAVGGAMM